MISYNKDREGYIHSIDTGGMVDGPGIRYVIFLSGCHLRCKYCHNPDTWKLKDGKPVTVEEAIKDVKKYSSYLKFSGGGVTITGGDPFVQSEFLIDLLAACKSYGIHTTVDTSGYAKREVAERALQYTDLLLLDIKSFNPDTFKNLTGVPINRTLEVLELSRDLKVPVWMRFVLVPGYTDNMDDIKKMADHLKLFDNVKKIDVLPFHKLGEYKWANLGIPYELADVQPPSKEVLEQARSILKI
ncbi:MAG: pyruvate formate-lyase-activating protein [Defluviitaleaceae bacterium]|nr:pyruvate formate-lyase-activating protein [Defluviitaleaceae bacterium]